MRRLFKIVFSVVTPCVLILAGGPLRAENQPVPQNPGAPVVNHDDHKGEVPMGLLRLGDGVLFPAFALVVDKSVKKIHLIDNSSGTPVVVESYDADMGKNAGDKLATGDSRTPEGIYFLQRQLEGHGLDPFKYGVMAFVTDYPNFFDLNEGKTGYGIWLHAIDDHVSLERGSKGCVVVRNDTIKELSKNITLRETPLMIFDKIQWVPWDVEKKMADPILQVVGEWRKAWEAKDLDKYMSFYDEGFKSNGMNRKAWRRYKSDLAQRYSQIKVSISMPVIYAHDNTLVVRFFQDYESDSHSDFGEKTLYFLKRDAGYRILGESWQEATNPKARQLLASGSNVCCQISN